MAMTKKQLIDELNRLFDDDDKVFVCLGKEHDSVFSLSNNPIEVGEDGSAYIIANEWEKYPRPQFLQQLTLEDLS